MKPADSDSAVVSTANWPPVTLIGAPTDVGANIAGSRMGPEALRVAGFAAALRRFGLDVADMGDLSGPPRPPDEAEWANPSLAEAAVEPGPPTSRYRRVDEVLAWNRAVYAAVGHTLGARRLPILMGGDHCLAIGSIAAVARHCRATGRALRVLWFDAHADFNTVETSPSGNLHGMPLAVLCGLGLPALVNLAGTGPLLQAEQVRQIGVRSVDPVEKRLLSEMGIVVHDMRYIDEVGMRTVMAQALTGVDAQTHLHVSFDMDCLDPGDAPGVSTPVRGGLTYREAQLCMEMIADTGALNSLDLVELNPALDTCNRSALLCVDLVESLFGKSTLLRWHR